MVILLPGVINIVSQPKVRWFGLIKIDQIFESTFLPPKYMIAKLALNFYAKPKAPRVTIRTNNVTAFHHTEL